MGKRKVTTRFQLQHQMQITKSDKEVKLTTTADYTKEEISRQAPFFKQWSFPLPTAQISPCK